MKEKNKRKGGKEKTRNKKREGDGFTGVEERGYWGGQDLILITLDRHECFSVFHHLQKDKQRKQRHSWKLGKERRESSKRNYYIISPRVIIKAIIIKGINVPSHLQSFAGAQFNFWEKFAKNRKKIAKNRKKSYNSTANFSIFKNRIFRINTYADTFSLF